MKQLVGFCFLVLSLGACSPSTEGPQREPVVVSAGQKSVQEQYLWEVMRRVAQFPYVPKEAGLVHDAGTILLRLTVSRDGRLLDVGLERSSRLASLDAGVMDSVRRASPYPPLPKEIVGDSFTFKLPVTYRYTTPKRRSLVRRASSLGCSRWAPWLRF